jgi:hypothetical protein
MPSPSIHGRHFCHAPLLRSGEGLAFFPDQENKRLKRCSWAGVLRIVDMLGRHIISQINSRQCKGREQSGLCLLDLRERVSRPVRERDSGERTMGASRRERSSISTSSSEKLALQDLYPPRGEETGLRQRTMGVCQCRRPPWRRRISTSTCRRQLSSTSIEKISLQNLYPHHSLTHRART